MNTNQVETITKDPDSRLDYRADWASWLAESADDDAIDTSEWIITPDDDLTQDGESQTATTATVWLVGGTLGQLYAVTNRITTAQGRTEDHTIPLLIAEH